MRHRLAATAILSATIAAVATAPNGSAATVLTVAGNQLVVSTPMSQELRGDLCRSPNVCKAVEYPSASIGSVALQQGAVNLQKAIASTSGKKIVMAYSQAGYIVTMWVAAHAHDADAPSRDDLTFIVFGNPQRAIGGFSRATGGASTPSKTGYRVIDVSREYDLESDFPTNPFNALAVANAFAGYLLIHTDYTGVDINDPRNLVKTVDDTTYVLVPTDNLPLLQPLRMLGLNALADQLNPALKKIVDAGYDRSGFTPQTTPVFPLPEGSPTSSSRSSNSVTVSSKLATSQRPTALLTAPAPLAATAPTTYSLATTPTTQPATTSTSKTVSDAPSQTTQVTQSESASAVGNNEAAPAATPHTTSVPDATAEPEASAKDTSHTAAVTAGAVGAAS